MSRWITIEAERILYVHRGRDTILCTMPEFPLGATLVLKERDMTSNRYSNMNKPLPKKCTWCGEIFTGPYCCTQSRDGRKVHDPYLKVEGSVEGGAAVVCRLRFEDFVEAMEFNAMLVDFILKHDPRRCAECHIPMTSATAEDREDGLLCDKCLTAAIDGQPAASIEATTSEGHSNHDLQAAALKPQPIGKDRE